MKLHCLLNARPFCRVLILGKVLGVREKLAVLTRVTIVHATLKVDAIGDTTADPATSRITLDELDARATAVAVGDAAEIVTTPFAATATAACVTGSKKQEGEADAPP
jgi:hypothetical protein